MLITLSPESAVFHSMSSPQPQPREVLRVEHFSPTSEHAAHPLIAWPSRALAALPMRGIRSRPRAASEAPFPSTGQERSKGLTVSDRLLLGYLSIGRCQPGNRGSPPGFRRPRGRLTATSAGSCPGLHVHRAD